MPQIDCEHVRGRLYLVAIAVHILIAALLPFSSVSINIASIFEGYAIITIFMLFNVIAAIQGWRRVRDVLDIFIAGFVVITPLTISTYLAISIGFPITDDILASWDAAIGFNWLSFVAYVEARPWLASTLRVAYASFFPQIFLVPILLAATGSSLRAASVVTAYVIICLGASFISVWFPAVGAYEAMNLNANDFTNIHTKYGYHFIQQFYEVRQNPNFVFSEEHAAGILTFPSVHAGVAAICAWGAWALRFARWPLALLNVAMATAAISHGGRYLVDVGAGIGLAAASIALAKVILLRRFAIVSRVRGAYQVVFSRRRGESRDIGQELA